MSKIRIVFWHEFTLHLNGVPVVDISAVLGIFIHYSFHYSVTYRWETNIRNKNKITLVLGALDHKFQDKDSTSL